MKAYNPRGSKHVELRESQQFIHVSIVDQNTLFRSRLAETLRQQPDFVVQVFPDLAGMLAATRGQDERKCVICTSVQLDDDAGNYSLLLDAFEHRCLILDTEPCLKNLVKFLTIGFRGYFAEILVPVRLADAIRAVESGAFWISGDAQSCLVKIASDYLIRAKRRTDHRLTEREKSVLSFIANGLTNREIAEKLYLSLATVKATARSVFAKLEIHDRTKAAVYAWETGIIERTN